MSQLTILILVLVSTGISEIYSESSDDQHEVSIDSLTEMSNRGKVVHMSFTCPATYGRFPVPETCEYFFECRFGYPTLMHCNRGYLYDKEREQCRDRRTVKCHIGGENYDDDDKGVPLEEDIRCFQCPYTWGTFPHPNDCSKYFVCLYNLPKLFQCYNNFLYDDRIRKCLPKNKVRCGKRLDREQMRTTKTLTSTTTMKPEITTSESHYQYRCPYPNGRFPDPQDCSRYYECQSSVPYAYQCPESSLYDETIKHCAEARRVNCGRRPGGNDSGNRQYRCPRPNGRYPDPQNCSRFYDCQYNVPYAYECPRNSLYDETMMYCVEAGYVNCGRRPGGNGSGNKHYRCPYPNGRYPDPQDCSRYYECRGNIAHPFQCPKSSLYDERIKHCAEAKQVNCGRRPGGKDSGNNQYRCPYTNGRYPDPQDCSRYYECRANIPYPYKCPKSSLYDEKIKHCAESKHVDCGQRPGGNNEGNNQYRCPYPNGRFPDPDDCSRYYECRSSVPRPYQCPRSTLYDETIKHCAEAEHVSCGRRPGGNDSGYEKFFCPFPYGRYPDPQDCSRYYECRFSVPYVYQCPLSTLYDEREEHCIDEKQVKCGGRPGGNDEVVEPEKDQKENFQCPYVWGTFAHPVDCSKYVVCVYNFPTVFNCRKDQLFHARYRRCLPKEKVSCDNRINPDDNMRPAKSTAFPTTMKKILTTVSSTTSPIPTTTTPVPTTTTTTPVLATTTTTPVPATTTTTPVPATTTTTPVPTTTTTTPVPSTTTSTPVPTTTTTTPVPTTTTITPVPTTTTPISTTTTTTTPVPTTTTPIPTTTTTPIPTTTTTPVPTTTTITPAPTTTRVPTTTRKSTFSTFTFKPTTEFPVTKPNTPPPTGCKEDDLDCIIDGTGDVAGWFDCPKRFGHFSHGSSSQLFIHCDNWRPFVKKCAEETYFSPEYHVCVWVDKNKGI